MKINVILSAAVFASTTFARLYKRDESTTRTSEDYDTALTGAYPTGLATEKEDETLSTDTGKPATADTAASSTSTRPAIPYTYDCVSECERDYSDCRTAPNANMSTCAAQYAQCLGYNPFNGEGSLVTPTECSVATSKIAVPTFSSSSPAQSSMASHPTSAPAQQDTSIEIATSFKQPIATCGPGMCTYPTMTDDEDPPMVTETPAVIVDGAGILRPLMGLVALAALVAI